MKTSQMRELSAAPPSEADSSSVIAARDAVHDRFRLLATMVQGTAATLSEAWQPYRNVAEARLAAREMMRNHRVLRVAIVEDRVPFHLSNGPADDRPQVRWHCCLIAIARLFGYRQSRTHHCRSETYLDGLTHRRLRVRATETWSEVRRVGLRPGGP